MITVTTGSGIRIALPIAMLYLGQMCGAVQAVTEAVPDDSRQAASRTVEIPGSPEDLAAIQRQAGELRSEQLAIGHRLMGEFPDDFDVLRIMGFIHSSHGNLDEMLKCWLRCRELQPNRPDVHDQLGRHAAASERYDEAIQHWQKALELSPKYPEVQQQIGTTLLRLGRAADAERQLRAAVALSPDDPVAHQALGEALYEQQRYAEAKPSYQRAVELNPAFTQAYYGLVKTCGQLREADERARYAKEFQRLESAAVSADLEFRRRFDDLQKMREHAAITCADAANLYMRRKRTAEAEPLWIRAAQLDSSHQPSRQALAALYLQQNKVPEALQRFRELAELQPNSAKPWERIGFLYARLGNLPAAEAAFQKMVQLAPADAGALRSLAKFYLNAKRHPAQALDLARRAVQLEPVADSHFVLGWAYAANQQRAEAAAALDRAVQLSPGNRMYRQLLEMVQKK